MIYYLYYRVFSAERWNMKRFLAGILALGLILSLTACKEASAEKQVFAMDTVMMLTAYGDQS